MNIQISYWTKQKQFSGCFTERKNLTNFVRKNDKGYVLSWVVWKLKVIYLLWWWHINIKKAYNFECTKYVILYLCVCVSNYVPKLKKKT